MGIKFGGITAQCDCGCEWRSDDNHKFCDNPEHRKKEECECYNRGGNKSYCMRHITAYVFYALAIVLIMWGLITLE